MNQPARLTLLALLLLTAVHLVAQLADAEVASDITQVLLMPAVAGVLLTQAGSRSARLVNLTLVALFFSWLGDTLPRMASGDAAFLLMVGGFLVAQIVYCAAFWPYRGRSVIAGRPWLVALAAAVSVGMVVLAAQNDPVLAGPVGIYAAALLGMVLLGTGVNRTVGLGAGIFLVSDAMIGLDAFTDVDVPAGGFWVMATYVTGQLLITWGVAQESRRQPQPTA